MKKIALLTLALALAVGASSARPSSPVSRSSKKSAVSVRTIYTLSGCPSCHALENSLRQAGIRLSVSHTQEYRYASYPTVVYTDGRTDSGQRIYRGASRLPSTVRVVQAN